MILAPFTQKREGEAPAGKSTGPKTHRGKENCKHNALKHGIFSQVALMKEDPRAEFDSLLSGLRNYFEPEGTLEELLVDKLVVNVWRLRRLVIAEKKQATKKTRLHQAGYFRELLTTNPDIDEGRGPLLRLCRETVVRLGKTESALVRSLERDSLLVERVERFDVS